jgi:hypothetical protein
MPEENDLFGPVISQYTTEQAVEDGVLVHAGDLGNDKVYFTRNLFDDGYEDLMKRANLVARGLHLLRQPDKEDSPYMKLRVIEKDNIWVIYDAQGFTFMKPEDY